jgi:hypothetical protein
VETLDSVGWQANPGRRGTLNIVENCIFTIVACTWSVQHLNVPSPDDDFWKKILRKFKWALLTIIFPEFLMAHAIFELAMAVGNTEEMEDMEDMRAGGTTIRSPRWFPILHWLVRKKAKHYDKENGFRAQSRHGETNGL